METIFDFEARKKLQKHYTVEEIAKMYSISGKTVYRWIYDGKLKANRIGGSVRIPASELANFIEPISA